MRLWLDEFKEHAESGDFMNDADGSIMKYNFGQNILVPLLQCVHAKGKKALGI